VLCYLGYDNIYIYIILSGTESRNKVQPSGLKMEEKKNILAMGAK
jgi:hypothetical protein